MSTTVNLSFRTQFNYLKRMRNLLNDEIQFSSLDRIDGFSGETKLYSFFVYNWIKNTYAESTKNKRSPQEKFSIINKNFIDYLDKRICKLGAYLLSHRIEVRLDNSWVSKATAVEDVWLKPIDNKNPNSQNLLKASMRTGDVLFACETALNQLPEKVGRVNKKELIPFIENFLPNYLSLLPEEDHLLKQGLTESFERLKNSMTASSLDCARSELLAIRKTLHVRKESSRV